MDHDIYIYQSFPLFIVISFSQEINMKLMRINIRYKIYATIHVIFGDIVGFWNNGLQLWRNVPCHSRWLYNFWLLQVWQNIRDTNRYTSVFCLICITVYIWRSNTAEQLQWGWGHAATVWHDTEYVSTFWTVYPAARHVLSSVSTSSLSEKSNLPGQFLF